VVFPPGAGAEVENGFAGARVEHQGGVLSRFILNAPPAFSEARESFRGTGMGNVQTVFEDPWFAENASGSESLLKIVARSCEAG
jgi:hypothetical protein